MACDGSESAFCFLSYGRSSKQPKSLQALKSQDGINQKLELGKEAVKRAAVGSLFYAA